jgi:signal transduction histidine kinase
MLKENQPLSNGLQEMLSGGGQTGALIREHEWANTSLGPIETWPQSLLSILSICLNASIPYVIMWGPELVYLYNDAYLPILGVKHPFALGRACKVIWPEMWDTVAPMLEGVLNTGKDTVLNNILLPLERNGYPEECYFSLSYSALRAELGTIAGVFVTVTETTEHVLTARRLKSLHALHPQITKSMGYELVRQTALQSLESNPQDIPFALLYRINSAKQQATRLSLSGIAPDLIMSPAIIDITQSLWPLQNVIDTQSPVIAKDIGTFFSDLPQGAWSIPPETALLLPIFAGSRQTVTAILIVAVNPHKKLDTAYREFFDLLTRQIEASMTDALVYEQERQKSEALAEINRAKTTFFSNISHELRTPLTLIQGPVEESLSDTRYPLPPIQRERQLRVQRNTHRLLKLVNGLLDFSRLEANRIQAVYEPIDLVQLTRSLANLFESAFKKAHIDLFLIIEPLQESLYVDKDMWEKIVCNLLSNALKYTLAGQVTVRLHHTDMGAVLTIQDTGVGIPDEAKEHVFERFCRVENMQSRSHEGAGIGLSLTQSLVKLHGGSIRLSSEIGKGSTFTVCIPYGSAHLPQEHISQNRRGSTAGATSLPFIEESLSWVESPSSQITLSDNVLTEQTEPSKSRILVIADNADMRHYLQQLLAPYWEIITADNGEMALNLLQNQTVDAIVSDVMMPKIDGFQLIVLLRNDKRLAIIPVILLSACAGEEAHLEGLKAGAADCLVKPFTPNELIVKIQKQIIQRHVLEKTELEKRLQTEFIDTVCHEIRNPLNGMFGCVDGLTNVIQQLESFLNNYERTLSLEIGRIITTQVHEAKEILTNLSICTEQQRVIVDDVLDLSKLNSNKVVFNPEPFSPKQAILAAIQMFQQQLNQKQLNVNLDIDDEFYVVSDKGRFTQLIINLLSNAIKFTANGGITIRCHYRILCDDKWEVEVHVKDTGFGMTQQEIQQLFQPFVQANKTISSRFGGSGLGLTICKKLVTMMGGTISVKSHQHQGSDFAFTIIATPALQTELLPIQQRRKSPLLQPLIIPTSIHCILIVEDNLINQKVLGQHLRQAGYTYRIAANGLEALTLYREYTFSLVFMDIEMPVMNGLDATREIRRYEQQHQLNRVPIVGLSGNARNEQIATALEAGMDSYITKPFHKVTILKHIKEAILQAESPEEILLGKFNTLSSPTHERNTLRLFNLRPVDTHTSYWNAFKKSAQTLLANDYPFTYHIKNEHLAIELLPHMPQLPQDFCAFYLKKLKKSVQTVFGLEESQISKTETQLILKNISTEQRTAIETVLKKANFKEVATFDAAISFKK